MSRLSLLLLVVASLTVAASDASAPGPAEAPAPSTSASETLADAIAEALGAVEEHRPAVALELAQQLQKRAGPDSEAGRTGRLIETFALLKLRRAKEAYAALERLEEAGPELGTYATFLRAGATAALRGCEAAEALAETLPHDSSYAPLAWSRVVSCWTRKRDVEAAERALARLQTHANSDSRRAVAVLMRARIAEAAGKRRAARDAYRDILVHYPLTAAGRTARARLAELKQAGVRVRPLAPQELLPRAEIERSMMRPHKARRLYHTIARKSRGRRHAELRHAAQLGIVELDIVGRRYPKAIKRLNEVLEARPDDEVAARALYLKGDILSRLGRVRESLAAYQLAVHAYPETAYAAEAALSAARLAYNTRRMALARALAEWMIERPQPADKVATLTDDGARRIGDASGGLRDEALWLLAWIERRDAGPHDVMDSYLAQIDANGALADAALYWRARLAIDAGRIADGEVFADLLAQHKPTSYYALAASDLIARVNPGCDVRIEAPPVDSDVPPEAPAGEPRDLMGAVVLFEHGLKSEARQILRLLPAYTLGGADRLAAAWLYRRCGDVHRAAIVARRLADGASRLDDPTLLSLAYPRPFQPIVEKAASEHGVPADLIYAVIRQESAFNPNAVSPRYARGLMQMIRPTARRMAREAELERFRQKQLYDPAISIELGAIYLRSLLDQFDGNLAAALASYHAGEHNVARWLRTRRGLQIDELIEEIPFATTRGYVKKVLSAYGVYRLAYGPSPQEAIPLTVAGFAMAAPTTAALR